MTLMELILVIIIIGVIAAIALPQFTVHKESALDKEAETSLKLIATAEKIYRMDVGGYYPLSGSELSIANINNDLKLSLVASSNRKWDYGTWSTGCARATRYGGDGRSWYLTIDDADGKPDSGEGCP